MDFKEIVPFLVYKVKVMLQYSGGQHLNIIIFLQLVPQLSLGEVISAYIVSICLMRLKIDY